MKKKPETETKPRNQKSFGSELKKIYQDRTGELPNLTHLEKRPKRSVIQSIWVFGLTVLLFVVGSWGSFLFWTFFRETNHVPEITSVCEFPDKIHPGVPFSGKIRLYNATARTVSRVNAELFFPPGFERITQDNTEIIEGNTWHIGSLPSGSDQEISLSGIFISEPEHELALQARVLFQPINTSSEFQETFRCTLPIADSPTHFVTTSPTRASVGDEVTYVVTLQNRTLSDLKKTRIVFTPNPHLRITENLRTSSKTGAHPSSEDPFLIETLTPDENITWTIKAVVLGGEEAETAPQTTIALQQQSTEGVWVTYQQETYPLEVIQAALEGSWIVKGSEKTELVIEPSKSVKASFELKNNGTTPLDQISVVAKWFDEQGRELPIDWKTAFVARATRVGSTLTWSPKEIETLKHLPPGSTETFDLTLPVLSLRNPQEVSDRFYLTTILSFIEVGGRKKTITLQDRLFFLASETNLSAEVLYTDETGVQVGSGPLPPTVGKPTSYRVIWRVRNQGHELENTTISALLPAQLEFSNSTTNTGNLQFNPQTRRIEWKPERVPMSADLVAEFSLTLTPTKEDIGYTPTLLHETTFFAKDTVTEQVLTDIYPALTTVLREFSEESGNTSGVVIEQEP